MFMRNDSADVAAEITAFSVQQNVSVGKSFEFTESEPFCEGTGFQLIKHRRVRRPFFKGGGFKSDMIPAVFPDAVKLTAIGVGTRQSDDFRLRQFFVTFQNDEAGLNFTADVDRHDILLLFRFWQQI